MAELMTRPVRTADEADAVHHTGAVLARLRMLRAGRREERRKSIAYTLYCTALLVGIWGVPLLVAAAQAGADGRLRGPAAERLLSALPTTLPAVLATVVLVLAERAMWQGPVLLERAALSWLLPQPVLRRALLLPRFVVASVTTTAIATAAGAVAGFLLHALGAGAWWAATAGGAMTGATAGFAGTALATLVQRHCDTGLRRRAWIRRTAWAVVAVLWLLAAVSLAGGSWAGEQVVPWSGPWGWAALPLVAVAGGAPAAAGWAGVALSALVLAAAGRAGADAATRIPARVLRTQAGTALRVQASLYSLDLRQARAAVRATRSRTVRSAVRLPFPRRVWLLVPWRDATALLRAPGRPAWAAIWAAVAVALLCLDGTPAAVPLMALPAGYLAAAQLAEPARLETDDVRRSAHLPWPARVLALWHGAVPAAGLLVLFALGAAAAAGAGLWSDRLLVLPALVPALVGAALVSAYRGVVPVHLMIGSMTPLGDTGPLAALLWQARGPLVALGCLAVVDGPVRGGEPDAVGLLWPLVVGAGTAWWAGVTARRTMRGR
ncbi:DUF6297 family protein [Streptomyces sp. NPDC017966]|uniref:DUF6297 family protein n=1 Tax=unclassified Streptomyces TaxID=2593676 RepID=UPI001C20FC0A|nr:DUF6297 family protein [Streptomyces sp. AC558_RSS880]